MSKKNKNKNKPWQQAGGYPGGTGGFGGLTGHSAQTILSSAGSSPLSKGENPASNHHTSVNASGQLGADSPSGGVAPTDGLGTMSDQQLVDEARAETEAPAPATTGSPDPLTAGGSPEASPASASPPVATQVSRAELVEAIRGLRSTRDDLNRLKDQADAARVAHERAKAEVATRLEELERREVALSARETDVSKRDSELEARRLELLALQAAASEGFPEQLRDARNALEAAHQRRVADVDAQRALLQQERGVFDEDVLHSEKNALKSSVQSERSPTSLSISRTWNCWPRSRRPRGSTTALKHWKDRLSEAWSHRSAWVTNSRGRNCA